LGSARNLELKVRCDEPFLVSARARADKLGVAAWVELRQVDTYFAVTAGRLKVREIEILGGDRSAQLIAYRRGDHAGSRWSDYHLAMLVNETANEVKAALSVSPGVSVSVRKLRQVGIWRQTRIHLDTVEGLGQFIELETVLAEGGDETTAREEHELVNNALGLDDWPAVEGSYSDLIAGPSWSRQATGN
jgi:adenylate cyclase, class 2